MNRQSRIQIADQTLGILQAGTYTTDSGNTVDISAQLKACVDKTDCFEPLQLEDITEDVLKQDRKCSTVFNVANETTLCGAKRLVETGKYNRVGVLNFASAKNPGGGFRSGAQAQEESLARSSGLYKSQIKLDGFYSYHKGLRTCLYSDRMIYSPDCPVFRDDDGTLLDQPYLVDFITSPAPNAGAVARNEPTRVSEIEDVLRVRATKVLALAAHHHCDAIVLGAWGCGVFRNDPGQVSQIFADLLAEGKPCYGVFREVLFSVLDHSADESTYKAFRNQFA